MVQRPLARISHQVAKRGQRSENSQIRVRSRDLVRNAGEPTERLTRSEPCTAIAMARLEHLFAAILGHVIPSGESIGQD